MSEIERLQQAYCDEFDREYRRTAGQFFTPRWVASAMAKWVVATGPASIVDPAFGLGMLLDECFANGFAGQALGFEIDPELVSRWSASTAGSLQVTLQAGDFLSRAPSSIDAAIVNPPYNRFQNRDLTPGFRTELACVLGEVASGYTNQYALFLYAVVSRLSMEGRAAFIVPSEFLATGYGVQVKRFLMRTRRLRHLVIFDSAERIFPDAITTACVLLFDGGLQSRLGVTHLAGETEAAAFAALCEQTRDASVELPYSALDATLNWQSLGVDSGGLSGLVELRSFGHVSRGIATGANEFFVLRPSDAARLNLTADEVVPCIASAASVQGVTFTPSDWDALCGQDQPAYLFDGATKPGVAASSYITQGEDSGFHRRYLTRMRRPWYKLEQRRPATLLLAVFGRDGFRAILNRSAAVNLTAFHGFYPHDGKTVLVELLWLYLQTQTAKQAFAIRQRAYGDGLKKLEPGDWSRLLVPDFARRSPLHIEQACAIARQAQAAWAAADQPRWDHCVALFEAWLAQPSDDERMNEMAGLGQLQLI